MWLSNHYAEERASYRIVWLHSFGSRLHLLRSTTTAHSTVAMFSNSGGHSHHDIDLGSIGIPEGGSDSSASASVLQLLHGRHPPGSASSSSSLASSTTTPSPAILGQYLMQRSEAARESYPSALSRPSNGKSQETGDDFARKKLYLKTDCRKVYFPGSVIEGVVALDRSWFQAGPEAADGFDRVSVTFQGTVASYGIENKTANKASVEELVLFSDTLTLKPFVSDRIEEHSPTGLSITDLELHGADTSLQGWHLRAVLPESVRATRYVTSKNLFTKRKETFDVLLPPTFRDDRRARAGQNSVCYSFIIRASRRAKNQPDSTLTVPILFMPLALGPSPPLYFTLAPGEDTKSDQWVVQTFREKLRRGLVLDRAIFVVQVTVPTLQNVRTGMQVPMSVICSVSSKDAKDLGTDESGGGGAITMPTLPLSGARESFPTSQPLLMRTSRTRSWPHGKQAALRAAGVHPIATIPRDDGRDSHTSPAIFPVTSLHPSPRTR